MSAEPSHVQVPARPLGKAVNEQEDGSLIVDEREHPFLPNKVQPAMLFTPVTFTNVDSPNEKLVLSSRELRKSDNKIQIRRLPTIKFVNSKYVATTREEVDRIRASCPSCYEEPAPDEREGKQEYTKRDGRNRVVFSTYIWDAFDRFQKIYDAYAG